MFIFFCVLGVCYALFLCFRLSVPVQLIAWKDSSPKWPIMCREGRKTLPYHTILEVWRRPAQVSQLINNNKHGNFRWSLYWILSQQPIRDWLSQHAHKLLRTLLDETTATTSRCCCSHVIHRQWGVSYSLERFTISRIYCIALYRQTHTSRAP